MSKLFEQLQKAAVAKARMAPGPVIPPQAAADIAAARAAQERERVEIEGRVAAEKRLEAETQAEVALTQRLEAERRAEEAAKARLEVELLSAQKAQRLAELEREAQDAEWARIAAEEAVRKAAATSAPQAVEPLEPPEALSSHWGFTPARGFAAAAVLAILAVAGYFVPWRAPGAEPAPAKPPSALKIDPKLNLARPK